ncbi:transposase [Patescibacteria group bacterium]|nr:transposase [Patescibacteria group bacterium]
MKNAKLYRPNTFYHVYNRGNRKQIVFWNSSDYVRFTKKVLEYEKLYDLTIYKRCLMPNHYHMLIRLGNSVEDISRFMHRSMTAYTMYFNKKYDLVGSVFQGPFRVKRLEGIQDILRTSEYIDKNPVKAGLVRRSEDYKWLSGSFGKEEETYYLLKVLEARP